MIWWAQIIAVVVAIICFMVLLSINRRQDAMQQVYMLSILLTVASLFVPDAWALFVLMIAAIMMLRAWNFRVLLALILGILTVGLYATLAWFIWPDSGFLNDSMQRVVASVDRVWGVGILPLWMQIATGALVLLGMVAQFAHFSRFTTANVRIQTRLLLMTPTFWLALISVIFPTQTGSCLLSVLWAAALYYVVLYVGTYGLPKMPTIRRKSNPYRRSYKHRRRK